MLSARLFHFLFSLPLGGLQKSHEQLIAQKLRATPHGATEKTFILLLCFLEDQHMVEHPELPDLLRQVKIKERLPSSSSRLAPPPVLTWLTLSSVFHFAQQVAVSPPPVVQTKPMRHSRNSDFVQLKVHSLATGWSCSQILSIST